MSTWSDANAAIDALEAAVKKNFENARTNLVNAESMVEALVAVGNGTPQENPALQALQGRVEALTTLVNEEGAELIADGQKILAAAGALMPHTEA